MKKTILIAEDEVALSGAIKKKLSDEDFEVLHAESGTEVMELAPKADLILLDIIMPNMDGLEALHNLHKKGITKNKTVIMLTNLDREKDKAAANENGAAEYIVKSDTDLNDLIEKIHDYLDQGTKEEAA